MRCSRLRLWKFILLQGDWPCCRGSYSAVKAVLFGSPVRIGTIPFRLRRLLLHHLHLSVISSPLLCFPALDILFFMQISILLVSL